MGSAAVRGFVNSSTDAPKTLKECGSQTSKTLLLNGAAACIKRDKLNKKNKKKPSTKQ